MNHLTIWIFLSLQSMKLISGGKQIPANIKSPMLSMDLIVMNLNLLKLTEL